MFLLIGTNETEGAQYVKMGPLSFYYNSSGINTNFIKTNIINTLTQLFPSWMIDWMIEPMFVAVPNIIGTIKDPENSTEMWYVKCKPSWWYDVSIISSLNLEVKSKPKSPSIICSRNKFQDQVIHLTVPDGRSLLVTVMSYNLCLVFHYCYHIYIRKLNKNCLVEWCRHAIEVAHNG